jgi:hypothetical protein
MIAPCLLTTILCTLSSSAYVAHTVPEDGGPPAVLITGKSGGDISAAEWRTVQAVDLGGCVPGARIVSLTFCMVDCHGKDAFAGGEHAQLTAYQRQMIGNLPPGTPFRVQAVVRDASGRTRDVPEAHFVWKG